jgi:RND superfamily putative drug exporter
VRVARWSATHAWWVIALWVLFVAGCIAAMSAGFRMATPAQLGQGDSGQAVRTLDEAGLVQPAVENVLFTAKDGGTWDSAAGQRAAADLATRMRGLDEATVVSDPLPTPDGTGFLVTIAMDGDPMTADQRVDPLLEQTAQVSAANPGLRVEQTGPASIQAGINDRLGEDFTKAEFLSLPITLLIMMIAFGAIVAAGVPVLLALMSVGSAMGLWALVSQVVPDPGQVPNMILLMGMAVGVDYSLFYLKRERQERAKGHDRLSAIEIAAATSGHSVVVSGLAVIVSMAALYLSNDLIFSSLATGSILVVAVAVAGSLTLLPALLAKLGRSLDRPRVPVLWRLTGRGTEPKLWPALLKPVLRWPAITFVLSVLALLALSMPVLGLQLKQAKVDDYPHSIPALAAYDRLTAIFPAKGTTHDIVVKSAAGKSAEVTEALRDLSTRAAASNLFAPQQNADVRSNDDGTVHVVEVATPYASSSKEAEDSVRLLRERIVPATAGTVSGAEVFVGGEVASSLDYSANVESKLPWIVGAVLLLTFLIMMIAFRSIVIGLVALFINTLSAGAAFGMLVFIFQETWAEGLLGFTSNGAIVAWIPLFLFVVLFGLSMDYHVFVVSSIREAARRGLTIREAVLEGISRSAGVVSSAAVVMVSVFAIFATLSFIEFKQLGLGLALAVLVDAVIIRAVVLPSIMVLLGRANWWPSKIKVDAAPAETPAAAPLPEPVGHRA